MASRAASNPLRSEYSATTSTGSTGLRTRAARAIPRVTRSASELGASMCAGSMPAVTRATIGRAATRVTVYGLRGALRTAWLSGGTAIATSPRTSHRQASR